MNPRDDLKYFEVREALWLVDTGLYHPQRHTLVVADLHLGYEESMRRAGVMLPETHFADIVARIERMLCAVGASKEHPAQLIVNGDLRHTFGPLNRSEWKELNAFFEHVAPLCAAITVVQGNHDPALNVFAARYAGVSVCAQYTQQGWLYIHGDQMPDLTDHIQHIVIGHEHPALSLEDPVTGRRERFKVFLQGQFQQRTLWVLPSFNALIQGTDLTREGVLSPLLKEGVWRGCQAYVRDDEGDIYAFGPIAQLI